MKVMRLEQMIKILFTLLVLHIYVLLPHVCSYVSVSRAYRSTFLREHVRGFDSISSLFTNPAQGQKHNDREVLHRTGATRSLDDVMMYSHLPFVGASYIAYSHNLIELAIINSITLVLSLAYHRTYEKPGKLCLAEGISAKLLFIYGFLQLFNIPSSSSPSLLLLSEVVCLVLTSGCFLLTNVFKHLYDKWHIGMHLVPAIWVAIVGAYHHPLLVWPFL